ncbi:MAG: anaerobic ribonucleoside-triphosphate reductase activating protein [Mycoplasmataceae bacterium]|nr:anaerobic ribonucleoside-triphosphate reductase activating protein [Mycoplasmataceae bacterium]
MADDIKSNEIRLAGISPQSLVNGPGLRKVYFSQGCKHHCFNCFNPETWSFTGGSIFDINLLINELEKEIYLDGVTFSGGDPMEQASKMKLLAKAAKGMKLSTWAWTGYTWSELVDKMKTDKDLEEFVSYLDVVVDGKFIEELRSNDAEVDHPFRGSANQKLVDVKKSWNKHEPVLFELEK